MAQNQSLSTQEVADILHVCKSTIYDLIRKGEIHSYKIGRKVRFNAGGCGCLYCPLPA